MYKQYYMTKSEKEQIQYLLTRHLEGESSAKEDELLFQLLDKESDDSEWEPLFEELIAAEQVQAPYERERWESVVQSILNANKEEDAQRSVNHKQEGKVISIKRKTSWLWWASAAAVLIIAVSLWSITKDDNSSTITTEYAQQKKIALPDKTEIILNAHSHIKYLKQWNNGEPREVWLNGEALFKVTHLNNDTNHIVQQERFIVHTNAVDVEVLGTVFNIRERRGKTEIVLQQGKIKVSSKKGKQPGVIMQPGQIVTVTADDGVTTNTIQPEEYTAWTKNKLILTNASFEEIVEYMEDNFGKKIVLKDPSLAKRKVEGTFKIDNLDDALLVLSKALNVNIEQQNDTLIFTPR